MIEVIETIDVPSDRKTVWALLANPREVVECVAGATLGEQDDEGTYDAGILVKFGPAKVAFKAKVNIEYDEPTMSGKMTSRGKDNQGGARFTTAMTFLKGQVMTTMIAPTREAKISIGRRMMRRKGLRIFCSSGFSE